MRCFRICLFVKAFERHLGYAEGLRSIAVNHGTLDTDTNALLLTSRNTIQLTSLCHHFIKRKMSCVSLAILCDK